VTAVLTAVERSGDRAGALADEARPAFETLRDALATHRTESAASVIDAGDAAGRLGQISRFLVAFLLPLGAIVAYRFAARRQLRLAEVQLDAQLEAEHEIHKAKDEFIANMSHELRTPLTSIYGFSEVLIENGLLEPEVAMDLIYMINGESAELGRMVEDLLVSARTAAKALNYSYQPVDLAGEAPMVITPLTRTGATVEVDLPSTPVWADPLRARQIIRNLVSNAIRHGGDRVLVTGAVEDDRVIVEVMDDGPGVPTDMVPRLFTRFVHDGEEALTVGSVGLGLAVVKELATAMNGDAGYRRAGNWTIFEFWLPLAPDSATIAASATWGSSTAETHGTAGADVVLSSPRNVG
jgi:signal transduction histidine kinase